MNPNIIKKTIWVISLALPLAVAVLYFMPKDALAVPVFDMLPMLNAIINSATAVLLAAALFAIRRKEIGLHRALMLSAVALSVVFLLFYVLYHATHESVAYQGEFGFVYYPILISHILLAIAIVPLVLLSLSRALQQRFDKHRSIARITWPLWFYVTVSGVVVYLMISPFYPY
jgi:putative membrane protein